MMNELMNMMQMLLAEVKVLRAEVVVLRNEIDSKKINRQYFSINEACEFLHIGKTKMYQLLRDGEFPWAVKRGRKWYFPALKLKQYVSNVV